MSTITLSKPSASKSRTTKLPRKPLPPVTNAHRFIKRPVSNIRQKAAFPVHARFAQRLIQAYLAHLCQVCHAGGSGRGSPFTIAFMTLRCTIAHAIMLAAQIPNAMPIVFFMMLPFSTFIAIYHLFESVSTF
jgi:hypothetical protein